MDKKIGRLGIARLSELAAAKREELKEDLLSAQELEDVEGGDCYSCTYGCQIAVFF